MRHRLARQGAFTLIEILLVMGAIGAISIGAFVIFPNVRATSQARAEQSNAEALFAGIRGVFGAKHNYSELSRLTLNQLHITPPTMNGGDYSADRMESSWNGYMNTGPLYEGFFIFYADVPVDICNKFTTGSVGGVDGMIINNQWVKGRYAPNGGRDPAVLIRWCSSNSGNPVAVYLVSEH
jgi:type II secretory pathway pseudopilin PulG